jgi:2-methylisocitrate lyase-like PEP mutase family enzyme
MDSTDTLRRGTQFRAMHHQSKILVLPNPWNAGMARMFTNLGFQALATTSAGLAFSLGRRDGDGAVSADETFQHISDLLAASTLPISADLENGFGDSPESVAATIRRAGEVGLAGASIEDATYRTDAPIYERNLAVERIHAAVEAAHSLPFPFTLTARSENFIRERPDLDDTLWRLQEFEKIGADVLYAPGLPNREALQLVCSTLSKPFNYVAGIGSTRFTLAELSEIGVRRISIGTSFARAAILAAHRAACEVLEHGTFDYLQGVPSVAVCNEWIDPKDSSP